MSEFINIKKSAGAMIIQLNRPRAINALTPDMIGAIAIALDEAEADASINLVLLEGLGEKGFCAGGDVRHVRNLILEGKQDEAFAFFKAEYGVNKRISTFPKPIVSLMHGFTMGGGIGLGCHARYRFATSTSKWAMPEGAIGYFADVGVRLLLAKAAPHRALMFLLRGDPHSVQDALDLNLCDYVVAPEILAAVRADVLAAARDSHVADALNLIAQKYHQDILDQDFAADEHEKFLCQPVEELFAQLCDFDRLRAVLGDADSAQDLAKLIWSRCPTTHACSILSLAAAQKNCAIDIVFAQEFALSQLFSTRSDFIEGVCAVLVDKDHAPKWERFPDAVEQRKILDEISSRLA